MKKITEITGKPIPLFKNNVDTDLIIPAEYLTAVTREGYGQYLFKRLREQDSSFVFNLPQFNNANILITQENFGCGSSREHAVWALQEAGIQAILAISFADIFFNNSAKNGLLLITLPEKTIEHLLAQAKELNDYQLTIKLADQCIHSNKQEKYLFDINSFRKHCMLEGLDDLDYLLSHEKIINAFEQR